MTLPQTTEPIEDCQESFRWDRSEITSLLDQCLHPDNPTTLRDCATEHNVPYSTFRYWINRRDKLNAPPPLRDFFESPAGLEFLQGLVLAAHLTFQQTGVCGVRPLLAFFEYAGLEPFLACSFGPHQRLASALRDHIIAYGQQQRQQLAPHMPKRAISLCEDENFHQGDPCLVAIEPVSNFLLTETRSSQRDAASWDRVVKKALEGLPVTVDQVSSDLARGIIAHARDGLGAHHSPDLMHLQQDLHRATALPLQRQVKQAQEQQTQATDQLARAAQEKIDYEREPQASGEAAKLALCLAERQQQLHQSEQHTAACRQEQEQVKKAIRGLGDDYHPFDASGQVCSPEALAEKLAARLEVVEKAAHEAEVSVESKKKIAKVRRWLPQLVATLSWYWLLVRNLSSAGGWDAEQQELLQGLVLAWVYWKDASGRGRDAEHRQRLRELAESCHEKLKDNVVWSRLSESERARMVSVAKEMAGRWVRSSSCVEGRNGCLRLRHHGRRGLSSKCLEALTVLHNYAITREDGTTAAERFFGQKPDNLFEWLRQRMPQLPRPAQKRPKKAA